METYQYVSVIDTLNLVISSPEVWQAILTEQTSLDGILRSFLDGHHGNVHLFFHQCPHALRLQLYYDELEIVNPLGSTTSVHKLGTFYFIVQNLLPHMNSELNSIRASIVLRCRR